MDHSSKVESVAPSLWMSGTPILIEKSDRIELGQKMPMLGGVIFTAVFPLFAYTVFKIIPPPSDWLPLLWASVALTLFVSLVIMVYFHVQQPVMWIDRRTGLIVIPRIHHEEVIGGVLPFELERGLCVNAELENYAIDILRFSALHPVHGGTPVYISSKGLRRVWLQFQAKADEIVEANKTSLLTPAPHSVPAVMAATTSTRSRNRAPGQA
jgi:hypothetical protein